MSDVASGRKQKSQLSRSGKGPSVIAKNRKTSPVVVSIVLGSVSGSCTLQGWQCLPTELAPPLDRQRNWAEPKIFVYSQLTTRKVPFRIPFQIGKTFQLAKNFRQNELIHLAKRCRRGRLTVITMDARLKASPRRWSAILAATKEPRTGWCARTQIHWAAKDEQQFVIGVSRVI